MPLSNWSKDTFVARDLSKFTSAELPDMSAVDQEQQHWLANFILNNLLGARLERTPRQQLFNFLRRSHSAFDSYERARDATLTFLADGEQRPLQYLNAIGHWEAFLEYAWQAFEFLRGGGQVKLFDSRDGSTLDRLNRLHNAAKHADRLIRRGALDIESPLVVWLAN